MTPIHAPRHHLCLIPSAHKYFACEMVLSAQEMFVTEKMAVAGMVNKTIATKRWLQRLRSEGEMVSLKAYVASKGGLFE